MIEENVYKLIALGRKMVRADLTIADGGNLSTYDAKANEITITRSGVCLDELDIDSFVSFKLSDDIPVEASSETAMHIAGYRTRPEFLCLLHFHPQNATLLAAAKRNIRTITVDHTYYLAGKMAILPFIQPGTEQLAAACANQFETGSDILLLAHHGCLLGSDSIEWGLYTALNLEQAAKMTKMVDVDQEKIQVPQCPSSYLKNLQTNGNSEMPTTEKQYSREKVTLFELAFGEGFMSCGGSNYLDTLFADEGLGSKTRILDICCGLGGSAFYLENKYGAQVTGIDREGELIEHAKRVAKERSSQCEFILGDAMAAHFDDNSFDYITCRDALLHFNNEQKKQLFQKVKSWLKPGGKFLATDYGVSDQPLTQEQQVVLDRKGYHLNTQSDYYDLFERNTFIRTQVSNDTESYTQYTQIEYERLLASKDEIIAHYSLAAFEKTVEMFKNKLQDIEDGIKTYWLIKTENYSIQSQKLKGCVVICTGASSGIGRATAIALASHGATVVLVARNVDKLNTVKALIEEQGGACCVAPTDVVQREQVLDLTRNVIQRYGRIDVLINSAGVMFYTFMENEVFDEWSKTIDVNITGVVNCVGAVLSTFIQQKSGHIINVSSDAAKTPFEGLSVYCASKAFVTTLSQNLRNEFRGKGIKVTDIQPGDVRTDLVQTNSDTKTLETLGINPQFKVGHGWASDMQLLSPFDVADCIVSAIMAKPHVGINEVLIEPRDQ